MCILSFVRLNFVVKCRRKIVYFYAYYAALCHLHAAPAATTLHSPFAVPAVIATTTSATTTINPSTLDTIIYKTII